VVAGGGDARGSGLVSGCGAQATGHGRRRVVVRDLPLADRPVVLVWAKRVWRCSEPGCPACTWSEECDEIARGRC
jgi:transposase